MKDSLQPIWPALFLACVLVLAFFVWREAWGWWRSPILGWWQELLFGLFFGIAFTVMASMGALALGYGLGALIGQNADYIWERGWSRKLVTLRSADGVEGSLRGGIFMMVGNVGSRQVYYYYTDEGSDSYKPHKHYPDSDTTIYEEDREDGEVVQHYIVLKREWLHWFAVPRERWRNDFHIPRGSIRRQFDVQ